MALVRQVHPLAALARAPSHSASADPSLANTQAQELKNAFELFNQISQQLSDSYAQLESRVVELNQELSTLTAQRLEALADKERVTGRLENLLNFLPGGVVVLDSNGRVSACNPAALELLGEPLYGQFWRDIIGRSFAPRQDDGHEVSLRDGRRISIATRNLDIDGQIILLTDQTETRRLQSELSRHERLSALGKMMSALAHQIRTPLSAAMLYAGHLVNGKLDEVKRQQFSEKICSRLNNIERQVQDMLVFAKGELPLNDVITVNHLQETLMEAMEVLLSTTDSVCVWKNECADLFIQCNREALTGALLNLVNNAIQAVEKKANLHITFALAKNQKNNQENQLLIAVCDAGPGIASDLLPTLGELFVTTKAQGTGLGLAVVKAVARAHRGYFHLQSTLGQGTCASLYLPLVNQQEK
jgi:two-component system, sensor histidine kinase FlrB